MPKIVPDLEIGTFYGSWEILQELPRKKEKYYLCRCICGVEKPVSKSNLRLGKSKSCNKGQCKSLATTHGKAYHPLYSVWCGIKTRLGNPTGANSCYSGIRLFQEWQNFEPFYDWAIAHGYVKGTSIDRIDPQGDYTPENCRWVTPLVQSQNRDGHHNAEIRYKGVFRAKPRNGKVLYRATGKAPYYFIVTYKGTRHQKWGFTSPEEAYAAKCQFIKEHYDGLVRP